MRWDRVILSFFWYAGWFLILSVIAKHIDQQAAYAMLFVLGGIVALFREVVVGDLDIKQDPLEPIHRKRLEWIARCPVGEMFPEELGFNVNGWGEPMAETAQAALDAIDGRPA